METAAEHAGCCLAQSKEDCTRPPCPCNMDAYSPQELRALKVRSSYSPRELRALTASGPRWVKR